jgi:hypothetical protein
MPQVTIRNKKFHTDEHLDVDVETWNLIKQKHQINDNHHVQKLIQRRLQRLIDIVQAGKRVPQSFHEIDLLCVELLITNNMIHPSIAEKIVKNAQVWVQERKKTDEHLPFSLFSSTFQAIVFDLDTREDFLAYMNHTMYPKIGPHDLPHIRTLFKRALDVFETKGGNEDSYIDRRLDLLMKPAYEPHIDPELVTRRLRAVDFLLQQIVTPQQHVNPI